MAGQPVKRRATLISPPGGFTNHIPATILKGDARTDAERAQSRAAYDLWLRDLRHIRRKRPLLKSRDVTEIAIVSSSTRGATARNVPAIDLTNDDEDDDRDNDDGNIQNNNSNTTTITQQASSPAPPPIDGRDVQEFYRGPNGEVMTDEQLFYQRRRGPHVNQYPSPGMLRFDVGKLRRKIGSRKQTAAEIAMVTRQQLWGTRTSVPKTFEESLQQNWLSDRRTGRGQRLIRGLPMMEDVVFLRAGNYGGIASNCFWKAIAYQVYGDHSFDIRVKAEHLEYFSEVLRWPQHPKCECIWEVVDSPFLPLLVVSWDACVRARRTGPGEQVLPIFAFSRAAC